MKNWTAVDGTPSQYTHFFTFDLVLGVKVTQNDGQFTLHNVTYAAAKIEVATSKGLGDAFTRKIYYLTLVSMSHEILPSTSIKHVLSCNVQRFRRCIL